MTAIDSKSNDNDQQKVSDRDSYLLKEDNSSSSSNALDMPKSQISVNEDYGFGQLSKISYSGVDNENNRSLVNNIQNISSNIFLENEAKNLTDTANYNFLDSQKLNANSNFLLGSSTSGDVKSNLLTPFQQPPNGKYTFFFLLLL